jgi:hypothetical protein
MKRSLLTILLFAFVICASGQVNKYHPFPTDSALWLQDLQTQGCAGYCSSTRTMQVGDTVINAVSYKRLYQQNGHYQMIGNSGPPMYTPIFAFGPYGPYSYTGALRQDTLNKKVYFYPASGMNHDTLLYDFDLQINDTLPKTYLQNWMGNWSGSNVTRVLRIDSIIIDAKYRKIFLFDTSSNSQQYSYLIEGIGNSWGPLAAYDFFFENGTGLACFNHNSIPNTAAVHYPYTCEGYTVGMPEVAKRHLLALCPNPATDAITVYYPGEYTLVEVVDLLGAMRSSRKVNSAEVTLDLRELARGAYFVRIHTPGGILTKKFIRN